MTMREAHGRWTERLSDYLGDDLETAERSALEAHLAECPGCRGTLEELRDVIDRARTLGEVRPSGDLWPGIARELTELPAAAGDATVIELPTGAGATMAEARRIALTPRQLAAASIVLVAVSAAVTWWAGPGVGVPVQTVASPTASPNVSFATDAALPPAALSSDLSELERVLDEAGERLDPNTVRVLERNLGVIEQAIQESRRALSLDPENEFLEHHLNRAYERKLQYLREAARVVEWAG